MAGSNKSFLLFRRLFQGKHCSHRAHKRISGLHFAWSRRSTPLVLGRKNNQRIPQPSELNLIAPVERKTTTLQQFIWLLLLPHRNGNELMTEVRVLMEAHLHPMAPAWPLGAGDCSWLPSGDAGSQSSVSSVSWDCHRCNGVEPEVRKPRLRWSAVCSPCPHGQLDAVRASKNPGLAGVFTDLGRVFIYRTNRGVTRG